jgi:hypothetical protein
MEFLLLDLNFFYSGILFLFIFVYNFFANDTHCNGAGIIFCLLNHQPINVPTAGCTSLPCESGERAITHHADPVRIGGYVNLNVRFRIESIYT